MPKARAKAGSSSNLTNIMTEEQKTTQPKADDTQSDTQPVEAKTEQKPVVAEKAPDAEPKATEQKSEERASDAKEAKPEAPADRPNRPFREGQRFGNRGGGGGRGGRGGGGRGGRGRDRRGPRADVPAESDYEEKNLEVSRVTRVTKGGKRMRFRVLAVIGNHNGRVGFGLAKGLDVMSAMNKANAQARKSLITVPIINDTIPHPVTIKEGAARIILKPVPKGTGVKAGGSLRAVLELAGVPNVSAKILGTSNKVSNVRAIFKALSSFRVPEGAITTPSAKTPTVVESAPEKKAPVRKVVPKKQPIKAAQEAKS